MVKLTRRQAEVASLVAEGLTNREIAQHLVISERTAEGHIEQIRRKLGVHSRMQIAAWVRRDGTDSASAPQSRKILYARNGDVDIAYHLLGLDGPDLLAFSGALLPIDSMDEEPSFARFHNRLASFSRLIRLDIRGVGLSHPIVPSDPPTLEQWTSDAVAVMDSAGSVKAAVFAPRDTSLFAILLAVTHPDRVGALVMVNGTARFARASDYPVGFPEPLLERFLQLNMEPDAVERGLDYLALAGPSVAHDPGFRAWWDRAGNRGASPTTARAIQAVYLRADVRPLLSLVRVPTLVLHRRDNATTRVGHGRYLAEHIPGAKYVELAGADDLYWVGDTEAMLDEIEEFLTGHRQTADPDRVLATVLSADIVRSASRVGQKGDARSPDLLNLGEVVRRQLDRFRGRRINPTGNRVLATFDGPARAVRCACSIRDASGQLGVEVRAGIHTGEVEVQGEDIGGVAVRIATQVGALAAPGQVLVSRTVVDLVVGSGIEFADHGEHPLKGVPGAWRLFAVDG